MGLACSRQNRPAFSLPFTAVVVLLAIIHALFLFRSATQETQTIDESAHIAAGYSYWLKHDFRLNAEHPPLSKLLCTAPLLILRPAFPPAAEAAWKKGDEFETGRLLLYSTPVQVQRILIACRAVTIFFTACFGLFLAFWTRHNLSTGAAVWGYLLFLTDPNLAAHGRYVTSDIFVMAFFFMACICWNAWLRDHRNRDLWTTGLTVGLALASKFNAVLLLPIFVLMWLWYRRCNPIQPSDRRQRVVACAALILIPAAVVLTVYGGDTRSVSADPIMEARLEAKGAQPNVWERIPLPAYYWFRGIHLLYRHQHTGHLAYLMGKFSTTGFVWYFPLAILVKTPTGTLLMALCALAFVTVKRLATSYWVSAVAIAIPPSLYLVAGMLSHIDIGIRHVILLYPFAYLLLAQLAESLFASRLTVALISGLMAVNVMEFIHVFPNPLAFFNTLSGGPAKGPQYLLDSNIDWGQGLIHLRDAVAHEKHSCLTLSYFGLANPDYYLPNLHVVPASLEEAKRQPCLIAVSVQNLYGDSSHHFGYLLAYPPIARPSYSIYLYDPARF